MTDQDPTRDELCLLRDSWLTIWQSYMRWFSWHFAIHLGAMGVVLSATSLRLQIANAALFMSLFGMLGVIAAARMYVYHASVRRQADDLRSDKVANSLIFGGAILTFASWACGLVQIMVFLAWVYIWFNAPELGAAIPEPKISN